MQATGTSEGKQPISVPLTVSLMLTMFNIIILAVKMLLRGSSLFQYHSLNL